MINNTLFHLHFPVANSVFTRRNLPGELPATLSHPRHQDRDHPTSSATHFGAFLLTKGHLETQISILRTPLQDFVRVISTSDQSIS